MIEIRAYDESKPITPDGPHSGDRTRTVADGLHEAFRLLNYATMPGNGGLEYPSDLYSVFGSLASALHLFPQALNQMEQWLAKETTDGYVRENAQYGKHGGDEFAALHEGQALLMDARQTATSLANRLAEIQSALSGLESTRVEDEDDE